MRFLILSLCLAALSIAAPAAAAPKHYALLIANGDYTRDQEWPDLKTPKRDVDALAAILAQRYGFQVRKIADATRGDIVTAIEEMQSLVDEDDSLFIYFAGHGNLRENDGGYWVGVNGSTSSRADWLKYDVIDDLIDYRAGMRARHVLVVADSCYSGAALRSASPNDVENPNETRAQLLSRKYHKRSRLVMTSGGTEPVLDSVGSSQHSVFAAELLDKLASNAGIVDAQSLFRQIEPEVFGRARRVLGDRAQAPEYGPLLGIGHDGGDFVFVPAGMSVPAPSGSGTPETPPELGLRGPSQIVYQTAASVHLGDENISSWEPVHGACYEATFDYRHRIDTLTLRYDVYGAEKTFMSFNGIVQPFESMPVAPGRTRPNYWAMDRSSVLSVGGATFDRPVTLRICSELVPKPGFAGDLDDFRIRNLRVQAN